MPNIAWKTINGYGPYAYLQHSVKKPGKTVDGTVVVSVHLAYLGGLGKIQPGQTINVTPEMSSQFQGAMVTAPAVPKDQKQLLKPSPLTKLSAVEQKTGVIDLEGEPKTVDGTSIEPGAVVTASPPLTIPSEISDQLSGFQKGRLIGAAGVGIAELNKTGSALAALTGSQAKKNAIEQAVESLADQVKAKQSVVSGVAPKTPEAPENLAPALEFPSKTLLQKVVHAHLPGKQIEATVQLANADGIEAAVEKTLEQLASSSVTNKQKAGKLMLVNALVQQATGKPVLNQSDLAALSKILGAPGPIEPSLLVGMGVAIEKLKDTSKALASATAPPDVTGPAAPQEAIETLGAQVAEKITAAGNVDLAAGLKVISDGAFLSPDSGKPKTQAAYALAAHWLVLQKSGKTLYTDDQLAKLASVLIGPADTTAQLEAASPDVKATLDKALQQLNVAHTIAVSEAAATVAQEKKNLPAAAKAPSDKSPEVTFVPKSAKGKALITPFNIKKLEAAAADGVDQLDAVTGQLLAKLKSMEKKAAVQSVAADLKEQLLGVTQGETDSASEEAMMIEQVAAGELPPPAQKPASKSALNKLKADAEKNKEVDWDKTLELVSGKKGSNEGGLYRRKDTQTLHYIKWSDSDLRVRSEALTGALYTLAGVNVPNTSVIDFGGKLAVKSDWQNDAAPMTFGQMAQHEDVREGFAADAWVANWDVVGNSADNIVKVGKSAFRIDLGGSLVFRAMGSPKRLTGKAEEIETLRSPATAPQAHKVFGGMTVAQVKKSAVRLSGVTDSEIDAAVDLHVPESTPWPPGVADAQGSGVDVSSPNAFLKQRLKQRRDAIVTTVAGMKAPKTLSSSDLKKAGVKLSEPSLQALIEAAPLLAKPSAPPVAVRKETLEAVSKAETKAKTRHATATRFWLDWKGKSSGTKANVLRRAAAKHFGNEAALLAAHEVFWESKGASGKKSEHEGLWQEVGEKIQQGVRISVPANEALARLQFTSSNEIKPGAKITLYRGWKPDQVQLFGWGNAQVGDEILNNNPSMFSHSVNKQTGEGFGSGAITTKTEVPVKRLVFTDRLNNTKGSYTNEDEYVYVVPKTGLKMEVIKKW